MLPFTFVKDLGLSMIPVSVIISFIFKALDQVGERTEDPFENRLEDTPQSALSRTIETNLKEQCGEKTCRQKPRLLKVFSFNYFHRLSAKGRHKQDVGESEDKKMPGLSEKGTRTI